MTVVLVTGMSGAGKSTALAGLARRGYETVDTDDGDWIEIVDGERLWRPAAIDRLLHPERTRPLFLQGTVANQGRWYPRFAAVVLLTAPLPVLLQRLRVRTTNPFGKDPLERAQVALNVAAVEPLLRAGASHVLDTTQPPDRIVAALVAIAAAASTDTALELGGEG